MKDLKYLPMKIRKTSVNKRSLIRWKVYFDRSRMYIGYIQFFLVGVVFLQSFKDQRWSEFLFTYALVSIPVALILFLILSLLLGYLDTRLGLREEEMRNVSRSNPVMMEMLATLKEIREQLRSLEEKSKNAGSR